MTEEKKSSNLTYEEKRLAFEKLGKYLSQSYRDERMNRVREKWLSGDGGRSQPSRRFCSGR